jgi:hypothetical protein
MLRRRLPKGWFTGPPDVEADDDEILIVGALPAGVHPSEFREESRAERMTIASELETRFGRKVSWGVQSAGATTLYTSLNVPVMTRLRLRERAVLDTLVDAGVARSRSEALGWCVKLVGRHQADWLAELREALEDVKTIRAEGPALI